MADAHAKPPMVGHVFPGVQFAVMALDLDNPGVAFAPRYYCPRCGPTNRIASAHGRLICIVCEFDLAQQIEYENARPRA